MSLSAFVSQNRPHASVLLSSLLAAEKDDTSRWLRAEMDRLVEPMLESIFDRLNNKLMNIDFDRSGDGDERVQVVVPIPQKHQPASHIHQPSTSVLSTSLNTDFLHSHSISEIYPEILAQIKRDSMVLKNVMDNCKATQTNEQVADCVKQEIKEKEEDGQMIHVKEEGEEEVNDIEVVAEDIESGDSRSVNAPMDTSPPHSIGQSQVIFKQSGRIVKRKVTDREQPQVLNETNNRDDTEEDYDDYQQEVTFESAKRARLSRPTTLITTQEKKIITLNLQCPQGCVDTIAQDDFYKHMMERHCIGPFACLVKDCRQTFDTNVIFGKHIKQAHQHTTQWQCDKCFNHFTKYYHLSSHNYEYHQLGHFQCSFPSCPFTGEYRRKVYNHYKSQHKPDFVCAQSGCHFRTKNATQFKAHERAHLGAKPYHCKWPNCHYSNASQNNAMKHIKRTHFKSETSPSTDLSHLGNPKDYIEVVR